MPQGSNLALECSFQVESTLGSQPAVIRWLWNGNRPITNNSEGVVSSQRFLISEYDYYLTTETTSTPYLSTPASTNASLGSSSSNFKFPVSNQLDSEDEDGLLPLIELTDLNQFHHRPTEGNQPAKAIDSNHEQRSGTPPSTDQQAHHEHSLPPVERHIVKRRIRKSRMEITFILELNQGEHFTRYY